MLVERCHRNPILTPNRHQSWEAEAVFNGCPIQKGNSTYLVYRAISPPHYHSLANTTLSVSDIGIAKSADGISFTDRRKFIVPDQEWDRFGCEDPRITKLNNKYYTFYTALSEYPFRAEGIKIGVAISKDLEQITEKHPVTPFNSKAMAFFPEKINGKMWAILTVNTDRPPVKICLASFDKEEDLWNHEKWQKWYANLDKHALQLQRTPNDHIEVGAQPIKTKDGWLVLYSYVRNYGSPKVVFTVEAALLDLKDPTKIIAKTSAPILTPEEYYEKIGHVPNIVFPSGAMVKKGFIYLYYGATDTTCCLAMISLNKLLKKLEFIRGPIKVLWSNEKEIISPIPEHPWESKATFNPTAIYLKDKFHILYRALSEDNTSVVGYATSKDGFNIDYRSDKPIYVPREPFEQKAQPNWNSGCEDGRITKIGNRIYMTYTAYTGNGPPRVALASILEADFLKQKWDWTKPVLISPPSIDDKDSAIFPEKINGKYLIVHRSGNDIDYSYHDNLDFDGKTWLEENRWIAPRKGMWDSRKVGIAGPPIKTKSGWLLLYHGISDDDGYYRVGAILTDLKDPIRILARSDDAIMEPRKPFEKEGLVPNVVFPCGAIIKNDTLFLYYGGADKVTGVATMPLTTLMRLFGAYGY